MPSPPDDTIGTGPYFDVCIGVGITMVARFGLPHRSMYPVLRTARSNYIFCSHVGQPLSVWDKRYPNHSSPLRYIQIY